MNRNALYLVEFSRQLAHYLVKELLGEWVMWVIWQHHRVLGHYDEDEGKVLQRDLISQLVNFVQEVVLVEVFVQLTS